MDNPFGQSSEWAVESVAVGVSSARRTLAIHGSLDKAYALASVTKPLAAWAVLVAVERGLVDLDGPVPDAPDGATVAHVLAHASGLPPDEVGPRTEPGTRRIYSNHGFDLLGALVSARTDRPFSAWLDEAVLAPLGMSGTSLEGSPAKDGVGTVRDLLTFGRELLTPTLLSPELHARATAPFLADLDGVLPGYGRQRPNPWGLGVEIRGTKSPHWTGPDANPRTFGHFGQSGSYLWVDPDAGLTCACLTGTPFGAWAIEAWAPFNQQVLDHWSSGA